MMSLRIVSSRVPMSRIATSATTSRALSSQGTVAAEKLRGALEEYRQRNYTQEIPSRFKKDIVRAAADESNDRIALDGMQRVLTNIGAENCLTSSEMKILFEELGNGTHMPVQNMSRII